MRLIYLLNHSYSISGAKKLLNEKYDDYKHQYYSECNYVT